MKITKEMLSDLFRLYVELDITADETSEEIKKAQYNKAEKRIMRKDGVTEVTEKDLWDEIMHLGKESEAGELLREKYPEVFLKSDAHDEKAVELTVFLAREMAVDKNKMTVRDILRLADGMFDYKISEYEKAKAEGTTQS